MEKIGEVAVEVAAAPLWNSDHELLGYFPAIFGPARSPRTRTLYMTAWQQNSYLTPKLYPTAEEALAAWQACPTLTLDARTADAHRVPGPVREQVNALGLYRERPL